MKSVKSICQYCGEKFEFKPKKYCSKRCAIKFAQKSYYLKNKEKRMKYNKKWADLNPEKKRISYNKSMRKNYLKNKGKYRERAYIEENREKIIQLLGSECKGCGKLASQIHHLKYGYLPKPKLNPMKRLEEYCKYLLPLCEDCHKKIHTKNHIVTTT